MDHLDRQTSQQPPFQTIASDLVNNRPCIANRSASRTLLNSIMGGGGKIPYPKHVWSPSGGWYAQPANWKANTLIFGAVIAGITAITWASSAQLEVRYKMPEPGRFYPSRYWSKQILEHERAEKEKGQGKSA